MTKTQRACGAWPSPITAAMCARRPESGLFGAMLEPRTGSCAIYWLSSRPEESGRSTLMRWVPGSSPEELLSAPWNVRTRIHEYGGGAYAVGPDVVWFSHFADGRLYSLREGATPDPLTAPGPWRYGDLIHDARQSRLIAVREDTGHGDHTGEQASHWRAVGKRRCESVASASASVQPAQALEQCCKRCRAVRLVGDHRAVGSAPLSLTQ